MTLSSLMTAQEELDEKTAKLAWIESKKAYFRQKGAFSHDVLMTYQKAYTQNYYINAYLNLMNK